MDEPLIFPFFSPSCDCSTKSHTLPLLVMYRYEICPVRLLSVCHPISLDSIRVFASYRFFGYAMPLASVVYALVCKMEYRLRACHVSKYGVPINVSFTSLRALHSRIAVAFSWEKHDIMLQDE